MPKLTQKSVNNNTPVSFEPYQELMLKALLFALAQLPSYFWPDGWLRLDHRGRNYLKREGLLYQDIRLAINAGVRRGLVLRRVIAGCPAIALKRLVQQ